MRTGLRLPTFVLLAFAAIASALAVSLSPAMAQQRRFAFVMGNGAYQNIAKLPNALNDANATRAMLQEAGFDVTAATDLSLAGLRSALDVFVEKVKQSGTGATALVYYAGHAVQLDGANYILPTDVRVETSANIPNQSLSLTEILRKLDAAGARSKIAKSRSISVLTAPVSASPESTPRSSSPKVTANLACSASPLAALTKAS